MKSQPIYKRKRKNKTASIKQERFTDKARKKQKPTDTLEEDSKWKITL
ncbi:hypothetical protein [Piscibacillus salipiscarius]|nr:hypothetical protein [Piscibacillus salipiscarius]